VPDGRAAGPRWCGRRPLRAQRLDPGRPGLIGASGSGNSGAAFLFDIRTGAQIFKLAPGDLPANAEFGNAAVIEGDYLVGAAVLDDVNGMASGSVYVFDSKTGQQIHKVVASDGAAFDLYGLALAVEGTMLAIGADGHDEVMTNDGAVYLIDLVTDDAKGFELFGLGLALDEGRVLVGGSPHDEGGADSGAACLYAAAGPDCNHNGVPDVYELAVGLATDWNGDGVLDECDSPNYCVATSNSSGLAAVIGALGSPRIVDDDFTLGAVQVASNQFGYFLMSGSQDFVPFFAGSSGNLCLGGPIFRFSKQPVGEVLFSGPQGRLVLPVDFANLPGGIVFGPGDVWYFQAWFPDVTGGGAPTSNTTDAIAIMFR
jgi:hypothetical protein